VAWLTEGVRRTTGVSHATLRKNCPKW